MININMVGLEAKEAEDELEDDEDEDEDMELELGAVLSEITIEYRS